MSKTARKKAVTTVALDVDRAEDIVGIIGECVHTALRKYADSPQSAVAWRAIRDLPDREWTACCRMAAAQVIRYLSEDAPDVEPALTINLEVPRLLHKWDGM